MLEDDFNDVIQKALRGHASNAQKLGVSSAKLEALLNGKFDPEFIKSIAPKLSLDTGKLLALPEYDPQLAIPSDVRVFVSNFGHLGVNAYLLETDNHVLIFDTGTDSSEILSYISNHCPDKEQHLLITHRHPDHVAGIDDFPNAKIYQPEPNRERLEFDKLFITTLDVAGHADPAAAYFIDGLSCQICIVGDAIFAGSIGGCQSVQSYAKALDNITTNLFTLPSDTYLCPGHGGVSTVAMEQAHNPFF